jgi:hypothetical protein
MALLGNNERMTAQRAHQVGLVSEVVPPEQLHDAANGAAQRIAEASPMAVQGTVRAIWTGAEQSRGQALGVAWAFSNLGMDQEAMQAFAAGLGSGDRPRPRLRNPRTRGWDGRAPTGPTAPAPSSTPPTAGCVVGAVPERRRRYSSAG